MWAIFGGQGWIGGQFCEILKTHGIVHECVTAFRLDDTEQFEKYIKTRRPDRVVSFVGRTHGPGYPTIDYLEQGREQLRQNMNDNCFAPVAAALVCSRYKIHFTYLGTGCIFTYDREHTLTNGNGWSEEATPNFFGSAYSIIKGYTDRLMHQLEENVLNLRIRMPISDDLRHPRNFLTKILNYTKICSIPNSMTVLPDVLPIMMDMIKKSKTGTYNLTNPGVVSHNEILDMYKDMIDPSFHYENFTMEEQNKILRAERSNNLLSTEHLEKEYFILPIRQSIRRLFKRVRKQQLQRCLRLEGTNLLVTGGLGFIGSNFFHFLEDKRSIHPVIINVDKNSYCSSVRNLEGLENVVTIEKDINETEEMEKLMEEYNIDVVIHFAAQSHVDHSFGNSIQFTRDNIRGTHSLLEASRKYGKLQRFIHISTDEVYGENMESGLFEETAVPNPTNPYAATKVAAEYIVQSYFHCFELPVVIVRGNNVYGPRQFPEKVIPVFITSLLKGEPCLVHGDGTTRRNFVYVQDFCSAVYRILEKGLVNEIYNIGVDNEHSVMEIAHVLIEKILGSQTDPTNYIKYVADRFYNDFTYRVDTTKLQSLGWKPMIVFSKGLDQTIEYYRKQSIPVVHGKSS